METALAQIATWCDTASAQDIAYFAYKMRVYLSARSVNAEDADEMMAEMLEFLE